MSTGRESIENVDLATLRECLWVAKNALGQIKQGAPSAYWRGLAEEALDLIAALEAPDER